jgi:signal transduction histidine kinase
VAKTIVGEADPVSTAARSIALRVGATTMLVVLLAIVAAALIFDRQQLTEISGRVETASRTADDVADSPPGVWLVEVTPSGREATPGTPTAMVDAAQAVAGEPGRATLSADGHDWPAWVAQRGDRSFVAVYDIRLHAAEEDRLIVSAAIAGAIGVAFAALTGLLAGRRAVRPLADALELQRQFVADASHELRTPLSVISMRAQLLRRRLADDRDVTRRAEADQLVADTAAMADVLSDLLLSAQLEHAETGSEAVDVRAVAAAVVTSLEPYAAQSAVALRLTRVPASTAASGPPVGEGAAVVRGVASSLRRAVLALVDNAISHAPPDSEVEVRVSRGVGEVRVAVVDHGPGVESADVARLTRRFARARSDGSTRRVGLGLALVSQIVRSHGGRLEVSDTPGGGATFTLALPAWSPR